MRSSRTEHSRLLAAQRAAARAEEDYQRLRAAYLEIARTEPGHEVALAMIGADMDRAHAHLQTLANQPELPFIHEAEPRRVVLPEAAHAAEEHA